MGGPFRAIVGGADQNMSFPPAQAMQLDNYSTQYGHLIHSDVFVAPGQIGMVVLVNGISGDTFRFEPPPGASQAAPTAGQICLIRTFDEAGPAAPSPLAPGVGVLLPIGVDQPPHHHPHTHGSHNHPHTHGVHSHNHNHSAGGNPVNGTSGPASAGTAHTHDPGTYFAAVYGTGGDATGATPTQDSTSTTPTQDSTSTTPTQDAAAPDLQHTHP